MANKRKTIEDVAKKYNRPSEEFTKRLDGRIEWVCDHGVGHTVYPDGELHCCDGCCVILRDEEK